MVTIGALIAKNIEMQMQGEPRPELKRFGQTFAQEQEEFMAIYKQYPESFQFDPMLIEECILNYDIALFGGPQYMRLMKQVCILSVLLPSSFLALTPLQLELAVRMKELPRIEKDTLVSARAVLSQGYVAWKNAVGKVVKEQAKSKYLFVSVSYFESDSKLTPIQFIWLAIFNLDLHASCDRLKMIALRFLPIAIEMLPSDRRKILEESPFARNILTENYEKFIEACCQQLLENTNKFVTSCTNTIRWKEGRLPTGKREEKEKPKKALPSASGLSLDRIKSEMHLVPAERLWFEETLSTEQDQVTDELLKAANQLAQAHFQQIRDYVAIYVELLFDLYFKTPLYDEPPPSISFASFSHHFHLTLLFLLKVQYAC